MVAACACQDLDDWPGSGSGASPLLVDQPWFVWLVKVGLVCIVVGTACAFVITSFLCVWWSGAETDGRLVKKEGKKIDSMQSKTMTTDEMMDDMKITFDEVAPPDPDAMRRAMQSNGDGSQKLVPTRLTRTLAMFVVLRAVLNFYTVFASFRQAMEPITDVPAEPDSDKNYTISRRVVAFMETMFVGVSLCQALYWILYLVSARIHKLQHINRSPAEGDFYDRTEDAYKFVENLATAASFSMIRYLPRFQAIPELIGWLKSEGSSRIDLWTEDGKILRNTSPFRFFCKFWTCGPCAYGLLVSTADSEPSLTYRLLKLLLLAMTPFLACIALVLKIRTVAPVAAIHYLDWSFMDLVVLLGFANQVASLQDISEAEERQTLHFAFAGLDGLMQKDEIRRQQNFPKFMSRVLIENHGVLDACAVLLNVNGKNLETLLKSQCTTDMMEELNDPIQQMQKLRQKIQRKEATRDFIKSLAKQYPGDAKTYSVTEIEKEIAGLKGDLAAAESRSISSDNGEVVDHSRQQPGQYGQPPAVVVVEAPSPPENVGTIAPSAPFLGGTQRQPRWEWKNTADNEWTAYSAEVSGAMEDSFQRRDRSVDVESQVTYCDLKRLYQARWDGGGEKIAIRRVPAADSGYWEVSGGALGRMLSRTRSRRMPPANAPGWDGGAQASV